jgi:REP element-mobilizing transposase RayT
LVFVTKYRRNVVSASAIKDLTATFAKLCCDFGAELKECNGEDDHVHLLIIYPPKVALSSLVNSLKGVSSRLLREHRPEITGRYSHGALWSRPTSRLHAAGHRSRSSPSTSNLKGRRRFLPGLYAGVSAARFR